MDTSATSNPRVIASGAFTGAAVDHQNEAVNTDMHTFANGSFKIKHSPGTGAYAGISGSGTYTVSVLEIAARSGRTCSMTAKPVAFQLLVNAQGPVHP